MIDVAAAIIIRNKKVLIARRAEGQNLAGKWEFPGGKIEAGETAQQCIERELYEELALKSIAGNLLGEFEHDYETRSVRLNAVFVSLMNEEFSLSVHDKVEWVDAESIGKYDLAPADVSIAKRLKNERFI